MIPSYNGAKALPQSEAKALPAIELKNAAFGYPAQPPLFSNLSLKIYRGEAVQLTGSNGCGKTTLIKLLNGIIFPRTGEYRFEGELVTPQRLADRTYAKWFHQRLGYVWQNPDAQLFCSSVEDEIAFGPVQMGLSPADTRARVADAMELLGISHLRHRAPYTLSGGEKKKTAIGSILSMNPQIWTMDEPMNDLDAASQEWLIDFLLSLQEAGKTIIFTSHENRLAEALRAVQRDLTAKMPDCRQSVN